MDGEAISLDRQKHSHGTGCYVLSEFRRIGENVVIEKGVLVFHPETIELGDNIYIGHNSILKGYYNSYFIVSSGTWIGQQCFFHSAGGIKVGKNVGIGPGVKVITSYHQEDGRLKPILYSKLLFAAVEIGDDADLGVGAIIMPGVTIGRGAQIGAGAVVISDIEPYTIAAGIPAKVVRERS